MCGIAGILSFKPVEQHAIVAMTDVQRHRGPDGEGYFDDLGGRLRLGHRRLSIIDLDSGKQPMTDATERAVIVYNGEVYNYRELRRELQGAGFTFRTQSDTEVVLNAYLAWGPDCLHRFRGMFAFAAWEREKQKLFIARDHVGIKPLHYAITEQGFFFGSELKSLHAVLDSRLNMNWQALGLYLRWGYIPAPHTIYAQCFKLPPGHFIEASLQNLDDIAPQRYWQLGFDPQRLASESECMEKLETTFSAAVSDHMVSDVPVGFFLSGGIDSSLVSLFGARASTQPIHTFSMGFPEPEYSELPEAEKAARLIGSHHRSRVIEHESIDQTLDRLVEVYDEPFGDSSALPTYFICQEISGHVKVALSGDGGDEMWGGYKRYLAALLHQEQLARRWPRLQRQFAVVASSIWPFDWKQQSLAYYAQQPLQRFMRGLELYFNDASLRELLTPEMFAACKGPDYLSSLADGNHTGQDLLDAMQWLDINSYLPEDNLTKVDRASMAASLEVRVPMLDQRMIALALHVSSTLRVYHNGSFSEKSLKYPLRRLAAQVLGDEIAYRRKRGFSVPLKYWLRETSLHDIVERRWHTAAGIEKMLNRREIDKLVQEHESGKRNHQNRLWVVLFLLAWWQRHQPQLG